MYLVVDSIVTGYLFGGIPNSEDFLKSQVQWGSNMTGNDLCVNKPHCAAAVRP